MIFVIETVFLTLKLCNLIDWNWWIVSIPFGVDIVFTVAKRIIKKHSEKENKTNE